MSWDFQSLFRRHAKELSRALRKRGASEEVAADLTQDTFLRVIANPPSEGTSDHNPRAYLFRVSQSLHANHRRRERLVNWVAIDDATPGEITDQSPSPERIVYSRECLDLTRSALEELPERTRRAFEMHRIDNMTLAEIGTELGVSTTRVWSLIRDAYRHLLAKVDQI